MTITDALSRRLDLYLENSTELVTNALSPLGHVMDVAELSQLTLNAVDLAEVMQLYLEHRTLPDDLNDATFVEERAYEFRFDSDNL